MNKVSLFTALMALWVAVAVGAAGREEPATAVERVDFAGWRDSWRLRSAEAEVVIVPQIGRVMHFSTRGGQNLLWVNQRLAGGMGKDDGQWHNFGGEKVWPTQQSLWIRYTGKDGWPPPYEYDCAPAEVKAGDGLQLRTRNSPHFGAHVERHFSLETNRPLLYVRQWHAKTDGPPAEMSLWTVAQVRRPLYALLPLGPGNGQERYRPLGRLLPDLLEVHSTVLSIRHDSRTAQKVGVPPAGGQDGWVAAVYEGMMMVQSHGVAEGATYPDGGCHAEVFTADDGVGDYIELELLSPLRTLKSGEVLRDNAAWQIVPITPEEQQDPEKAAARARRAHRSAMERIQPR